MNLKNKKQLIKISIIFQAITVSVCTLLAIIMLAFFTEIKEIFALTGTSNINLTLFYIILIVYTAFELVMIIHTSRKLKQNKQQFYISLTFLRIFSIIELFVNTLSAIMLVYVAYRSDDGKDEIMPKKLKQTYSTEISLQLKVLNKKRRKGEISEEYYERQKQKIIKQKV